jgi:hypothetical protein
VLGAIPPTVLLLVSLAYAGQRLSSVAAVPVFVTGVLLLAALDGVADRPVGPGARRAARLPLSAAAVLAAVAVAATVLTAAVRTTGAERYDLRTAYPPAAQPVAGPAPLAVVAAAADAPADAVAFRATVKLPAGDTRSRLQFRVATLETYDGELWQPDDTFVPVGATVSGAPDQTSGLIAQSYALAPAYPLALVPEVGSVVALHSPALAEFRYGRETGMLLGPHSVAAPATYEVDAVDGAPDDPPDEGRRQRLTALPEPLPLGLREYAQTAAGLDARQRLNSLRDLLRDGPSGFAPQAPPGHSYPRLVQFLNIDPVATAWQRTGTSEQAAAAFAVLARTLGHPARVVVGYDVPAPAAGPDAGVREVSVPVRAAKAWAEVYLDGGWVAFDPTSPKVRAPAPAPQPVATTTTTIIEARQEPERAREPASPQGPDERPCPRTADCATGTPPAVFPWVAAAVGAALVIVMALLALALLRRRRARGQADPARRLDAAWRATLGMLRRHGVRPPAAATPAELGRTCVPTLGPEAAAQVARWGPILDVAVYGPSAPTLDLADAAWTAHDDLAAVLRRWPARLRRRLIARGPGRRAQRGSPRSSPATANTAASADPVKPTDPVDRPDPTDPAREPSHSAG